MPLVHRDVYIRGGDDRPASTALEDVQNGPARIPAACARMSAVCEQATRHCRRRASQAERGERFGNLGDYDAEARPRGVICAVGKVVQEYRDGVLNVSDGVGRARLAHLPAPHTALAGRARRLPMSEPHRITWTRSLPPSAVPRPSGIR
mgnify:FL=1